MEEYAVVNSIALAMGASWASGINLYAAILVLGLGGSTGAFELPPEMALVQNPMVIAVAGLMYAVEFFADKIPGVDSTWDAVHTFIRIPAGALLAANAVGDVGPAMELTAGLLGGGMAATSHATKAGGRLVVNASPEPFTNWGLSLGEDVAVIGGLWAAFNHPWIFIGIIVCFLAFAIWILPKIWYAIKLIFRKIGEFLGWSERTGEPKLDPLDEIAKLKKLLDQGAISQEEFDRGKRKRLGDPDPEPKSDSKL